MSVLSARRIKYSRRCRVAFNYAPGTRGSVVAGGGRRGRGRGLRAGCWSTGEGRGKKYAAIKHSCNKTACNNRPAYFKKLICRRTNCLVSRDAFNLLASLLSISSSFILSFADFSSRRVLAASRAKKKQREKVRAILTRVWEGTVPRRKSVVANLRDHKSFRQRGLTHNLVEISTTKNNNQAQFANKCLDWRERDVPFLSHSKLIKFLPLHLFWPFYIAQLFSLEKKIVKNYRYLI